MITDEELSAMPVEELWLFHAELSKLLFARLTAQRRDIDAKLAVLRRRLSDKPVGTTTRTSRRPAAEGRVRSLRAETVKVKNAVWLLFSVVIWSLTDAG